MSKRVKQPDEKKPLTKTMVIKRPRRDLKKIFLICSSTIIVIQLLLLGYFKLFKNRTSQATVDAYSQNKTYVDRLMAKAELQGALDKYQSEKRSCPPSLEMLAPTYLQSLAPDNLTKAPFSYRIDGNNCIFAEEGDQIELIRLKMELHGTPSPQELAKSVEIAKTEMQRKKVDMVQLDKIFRGVIKDQDVHYQLECQKDGAMIERCNFVALGIEEDLRAINTPDPAVIPELNKKDPPKIRRIEAESLKIENGEATGITRAYIVDNRESKRELVKISVKEIEPIEGQRVFLVNLGEADTNSGALGVKLDNLEDGRVKISGILKIPIE